ncbi:hypothetical protein GV827_08135 [Sulfitobacter sp. JBTF-M27]|uniref:ATP-dependent Clp protease proteolytic subunit n=1 Tax=Sulfitobacter sediminilitoris TaxID=2698830 RepID=A0A6P0CB49_9RHOB|nr:hypothetical protein [Sulfitobacter sediminilitoris]NEK22366.1 hypothetical protein [Sulfitobacter sediminilitoris]
MVYGRSAAQWSVSLALLMCLFFPADARADRFTVAGQQLVYDTVTPVDGEQQDIRGDDVDEMRSLLRDHPEVSELVIHSTGGGHYASMELAALVIDFELDTHIAETCESSCVPVFLGGAKRTMARGARIGFHQLSWDAEAVQQYYDDNRERYEWETPFEFAEWMYQDTQTETYNRLAYMVSRGVDAEFAIRTIRKPDTTLWFPYRAVLMAAGVLTE